MSALACLVLSALLGYVIAQFRQRNAAHNITTAWREASELVFDKDLRFKIKEEYDSGVELSHADEYAASRDALVGHMASNLLMLAHRRLEVEPAMPEAEDFVRQHCDLDVDLLEELWISMLSQESRS